MQAVTLNEGGELRYESVEDPVPGDGEVVVELRASGINRRDLLLRDPPSPHYEFPLPLILGSDGAGVRRDTGEPVVIYPVLGWGAGMMAAPGWHLLGGPVHGTYAELVAVPESNLFPKPSRLSWEEAATLGVAGVTAYRALFTVGHLKRGETVAILGTGSGVSTIALRLARQAGARVLVTSSSPEKLRRAAELGAAGGALYTEGDWAAELGPLDLVLDSVGSTWDDSVRALRPGGRIVAMGATGGPRVTLDVRALYLSSKSIRGTTMGSPEDFAGFLQLVDRGDWSSVIDSVMPLSDADSAHRRMKAGGHFGKLILTP